MAVQSGCAAERSARRRICASTSPVLPSITATRTSSSWIPKAVSGCDCIPSNSALSPDIVDLVHLAISSRKSLHGEVHHYADESAPHIDSFHRPALRSFSDTPCTIGAVLPQADPNDFLFPVLQSWPTLSETGETLLVRRDGDEILYINEPATPAIPYSACVAR